MFTDLKYFALMFAGCVLFSLGVGISQAPQVDAYQPVDSSVESTSGEEVAPRPVGRLYAFYQIGGTRRNTNSGAPPYIEHPAGPNPLCIPTELFTTGLSRWFKDNIHESVSAVKPDAIMFHNPFGSPSLKPMAFHQRDMARDLGYLGLANGSDVQRAVRELRTVSGTDEVWFYLGTPDEYEPLSFNEFLYAVQPLINADVNIAIDSAGDEDEDSLAWQYAQTLRPWTDVGYEPRPHAAGPWKSTDMACFAQVIWRGDTASDTGSPPEPVGGFFSADPDLRPEAAKHMARRADINGEIVLILTPYRHPTDARLHETRYNLVIEMGQILMSQGYSVAISGWDLYRYGQTAESMREAALSLQSGD